MGTGWLAWSPDQTFDTPMPQLFLALEGKVDFVKKTNPFGSGESKKKAGDKPVDLKKIADQKLRFNFMKAEAAQKAAAKG